MFAFRQVLNVRFEGGAVIKGEGRARDLGGRPTGAGAPCSCGSLAERSGARAAGKVGREPRRREGKVAAGLA